jgi:dihydrolipoamide dehydrogenase
MKKTKYDLAVIGSGPGGYVAAVHAARRGLKVICIDKRKALGGTCLNIGCIPSKTLLQITEHYAWLSHSAKEQGVDCKEISFDFARMMQRKQQVVSGLTDGIANLFKRQNVQHLCGEAHLEADNIVEVTSDGSKQRIEAKNVIIATGSEPIALPFLPFDEKQILSSTGALELEKVPARMIVIGAGVIGVELASVYSRLGCEVTIVELLDRVCPSLDDAIAKNFLQILKKQKIAFHLGCKVEEATRTEKEVTLQLSSMADEKKFSLTAEAVLVAVGRRPTSRSLDLDKVGITATPQGFIPVDSLFKTNVPNIFAIGDVIEGPMLAHRATAEAIACAEGISGHPYRLNYLAIPNVIYTHPEVATVGATESEARQAGFDAIVGTAAFRGNARARCNGDIDGIVKVVADCNGALLGVHILGPQASEMIAAAVMAIEGNMTLQQLAFATYAHPTLSETIKEAAMAALGLAIHA